MTAGGPAAGPASTGDFAVRVAGVTKRYGNHVAVDGVSFEVPTGVIYGVLGPNGAGKSTTLRMINDIIAPDAGEIRLLGGLRPGREAAAHVGFLPEERGLYPKMRVSEMIAFMGELRGLPARDARTRTGAWLERLGLGQWARNKVQDLSKGMQQKVQFAATMIHEPELVILDEPWSGLDPINADVLRDVVREQKAAGRTILFSTHLMEQAEQICDRIFMIHRGRKVLDDTIESIRRRFDPRTILVRPAENGAAFRPQDFEGVVRAERRRDEYEVYLREEADPTAVMRAMMNSADLRKIELRQPSLEDVFVRLVEGTRISESGAVEVVEAA